MAHENVLDRMREPAGKTPPFPAEAWPSETFDERRKSMSFNGEGIEILHQPAAHTDGDTVVFFRRSDVVVAGHVARCHPISGDRCGTGRQHSGRDRRLESPDRNWRFRPVRISGCRTVRSKRRGSAARRHRSAAGTWPGVPSNRCRELPRHDRDHHATRSST